MHHERKFIPPGGTLLHSININRYSIREQHPVSFQSLMEISKH